MSHTEELRDKVIMGLLQAGFRHCPIGICVAISDRGVINRLGTAPPELCKADAVCDRIKKEIERHRKASKLFGKSDGDYGMYWFRPQETERIKGFLLARHRSLRDGGTSRKTQETPIPVAAGPTETAPHIERQPVAPRPAAPPTSPESPACKHCGSGALQAMYGQYGYYFKCTACGKNTAIDYKCRSCGAKGRIRKQGPRFDRVCGCGAVELVWTNSQ